MTENTLTLDAPELSIADYRAIREGRAVETKAAAVETPSATEPVATTDEAGTAVATEETGTTEETKQDEGKPGKKDGLQFRFSELTQKIKTLEAQLKTAAPKAVETPAVETPNAGADPEPDQLKYSDWNEYQRALIRWELRQERAKADGERVAAETQKAARAKAESWNARVSDAAKAKADYSEVALNPELSISRVMGEAITDSDLGTELLYELGKNPDEAARIAKLAPIAQVREIGRLEAKLAKVADAAGEESSKPKTPVVSKAPAPVKPVAAGAASGAKAIESMSQSEYRALRESGKLR